MKNMPLSKYQTEFIGLNENHQKYTVKKYEKGGYASKDLIFKDSYFKNVSLIFEEGYIKFENCVFDGIVSIFNRGKMGFDAIEIVESRFVSSSKNISLCGQSVEILKSEFESSDESYNLVIEAVSVDIIMSNINMKSFIGYHGYLNLFESELLNTELRSMSDEKTALNIRNSKINGEQQNYSNMRKVLNMVKN